MTGETFSETIWEAHRSADDEYGMAEALEWAEGYTFPEDIQDRDSKDLDRHGGNLAAMCRSRHTEMSTGGKRMSLESISRMCDGVIPPEDEDFVKLTALVDGIEIVVQDDFKPCQTPPALRKRYITVASVVNRLMADLHAKGLIFIIPTAAAMSIDGRHFSQSHWTFKKGKKQGRPLGDASNQEHGCDPLNSKAVKAKVDAQYGKIEHPTLATLSDMVREVNEIHGAENTVLWKIDLKGALHPAICGPGYMPTTDVRPHG
jgi:hypothetical protein